MPLVVHESEVHRCRFCGGTVIQQVGNPARGEKTRIYHGEPCCDSFRTILDNLGKRLPKESIRIYSGKSGDA